MSYCVHCGVELDATASFCPLCHTPVLDPAQPVDTVGPKYFPTQRGEVPPVAKQELALLITSMLASVAVCCGILNVFLRPNEGWSLYVIGAAAMLWLWLVPPLLARGMHLLLRLLVDILAVALYVYLIALNLNGRTWFLGLAAPIILWGGAVLLLLGLVLRVYRRSLLSTLTILLGSIGVFLLGVEFFVDRWLYHMWDPSWSLVVLTVCLGLVIPLIVIRRVPSLREEVRRRFHL
ncbi:zinc ribbon domain-containing protein [Flavonifractor hominis]|uniref:Zinc ribbon domain-containing protein n=1 Tax=Flavonifractor hominis TaxID=3133178 RepID=A0ABV1EMQ6_9FIRM